MACPMCTEILEWTMESSKGKKFTYSLWVFHTHNPLHNACRTITTTNFKKLLHNYGCPSPFSIQKRHISGLGENLCLPMLAVLHIIFMTPVLHIIFMTLYRTGDVKYVQWHTCTIRNLTFSFILVWLLQKGWNFIEQFRIQMLSTKAA